MYPRAPLVGLAALVALVRQKGDTHVSFVRSVYGRPMSEREARALMNGGRASSSRPATLVGAPAQAHVSSDVRIMRRQRDGVPFGTMRVLHRGCFPTTTACLCACHGTGDTSGRDCDVRSCVEVDV